MLPLAILTPYLRISKDKRYLICQYRGSHTYLLPTPVRD